MALNISKGVLNTGGNTGTIKRDVEDKVFFLNAETAPLISFLKKLGKKEKKQFKFEWYEKELGTPLLTVNGAVADGTTTTINVASGEGSSVQVNDVLYVPSTGEQMLVTAISGDALTVTRGWGETSGSAIADAATLVVLAPTFEEGTTSPTGISLSSSNVYNYTEIVKHAVQLTRTELGTDRYDETNPKLVERRKEIFLLHMEALERVFLFGQRKEDLTGTNPKRSTRGALNWISTNVTDCGGTFTRAKMNSFLQSVYKYRKGNKVLFVGADLLDAIDSEIFSNGTVNLTPASKSFGLDVTTWISPYGSIKIAYHRVLSEVHSGYGLCLDLDLCKYCYVDDTKLEMNIQDNDYDGVKDQYITEAGLMLQGEKAHGLLKLD